MRRRTQAREYALQIVYQLDIVGVSIAGILKRFWEEQKVSQDIQDFSEELVKGTWKNLDHIDKLITKYSEHWNLERMAVIDRSILRLAAYEILYRYDIPPKVSINEAVEISRKYSTPDSSKFINGILDKLISHRKDLFNENKASNNEE
ncbi:transcription antitermination factor NusB [Candidatus Poribacteria bacterium]|nr:transcription antitermination factor NusB [Candidatus Poribacteria bacterium]